VIKGPRFCVKLPRDAKASHLRSWLSLVALDTTAKKIIIRENLGVHTSHFWSEDEYETTKRKHTGMLKNKPRKAKAPPPTPLLHSAGRKCELQAMGVYRSTNGYASSREAMKHAVKILAEAAPPDNRWFDEEYTEPSAGGRAQSGNLSPLVGGANIWSLIKESDDKCWYYTGEENFNLLELWFEYINADGLFDDLRLFRKDTLRLQSDKAEEVRDREHGKRGRRTALTPFQQCVFWRVTFKHFRGRGQIRHAGDLFGIEAWTADRLYVTWTQALGRFFDGQQPPASLAQACLATSEKTKGNLGFKDKNVAVMLGDCTERWVTDPGDGALHSVFYSEYKSHTTIKYLTISTGGSYLQHIPRPFVGACTDNGAHAIAGVAKLFCKV
jgi:hypothetical protein